MLFIKECGCLDFNENTDSKRSFLGSHFGSTFGSISGSIKTPDSGAREKSTFRLFFGANRDKSHNEQSELEARSTTLISR